MNAKARWLLAVGLFATPLHAQTIEDFLSAPSPLELTVARKADRLAWVTWERGMRNVYTAAAPTWKPVRLTTFLKDDGQEVGGVQLSDDGGIVTFIRGSDPNDQEWIANPTHETSGVARELWAADTRTGRAWKLVESHEGGVLSPDGRYVAYVKDNQIYRVRTRPVAGDSMDRGLKPWIRQWGEQSQPVWSPDGKRIAFVSARGDHSFIGVYDLLKRKINFIAPSVDCDVAPTWSPDSKQIAFIRRPGAPFGMEMAAPRGTATGCGAMYRRFFNAQQDTTKRTAGLQTATFGDGSTMRIMIADVDPIRDIIDNPVREVWHNQAGDQDFVRVNRMLWANGHLVFPMSPQKDEWDRIYSVRVSGGAAGDGIVNLIKTDGLIEDETSFTLSRDGNTLYYSTNAGDIERRHIWSVPVAGGTPVQVSSGDGVETSPVALSKGVAVLYFGAAQPASVALLPKKIIYPNPLPARFPAHVVPQIVMTKAPDGVEIHNQLFLPRDLKAGEKRPAIVFVHGGPARQMMPAYHYMQFYHWAYAFNQYLASRGYIVLSVNYRLGVGYGRTFREAARKGGRNGNAEYQDVLAGGKYLQSRPDVSQVGIWGLSYGGLLTAQALARNSDVFKVGVDMAGVHLWGNTLDTAAVSYKSSPIAAIDTWKSPVLLIQGDDDRNVDFSQTVGLVQLLRARNVPHELIVIPDDTHESLLYSRWVYLWTRSAQFLERYLPL